MHRMNEGLVVDVWVGVYLVGLACFIFSYSLEALRGLLRLRDRVRCRAERWPDDQLPRVTVQLPVCNEYYVVERLIDACCRLDYPPDRLDIQVLDDSTDDTSGLIAGKVREHASRGVNIRHLRRTDRTGFKAGNLQHGLQSARGEFVAVFDADFLPDPGFLLKTLGHFQQTDVGLVVARVRHLNSDASLLTRSQDPFGPALETVSDRCAAGRFFNLFGGSAGVLRTTCLVEAGGWQADTLTEDQDVSIRAYLRGWRCVQLAESLAGDELQERMADFKNRVARCNTGPVECWKKHFVSAMRSRRLTPLQKLSLLPTLHCPWLSLPSVALVALASVPLVLSDDQRCWPLVFALPSACVVVLLAAVACSRHRVRLLGTMGLYVGTSFRGGWGTLMGLAGARTGFNRSTKLGAATSGTAPVRNRYPITVNAATFLEGALAACFLTALVLAVNANNLWFVPIHLLCFLSCSMVCALSVVELT